MKLLATTDASPANRNLGVRDAGKGSGWVKSRALQNKGLVTRIVLKNNNNKKKLASLKSSGPSVNMNHWLETSSILNIDTTLM